MEKVRGFEKIVPDSDVKLPVRKTAGSAGYDFYAPYDIEIPAALKRICRRTNPLPAILEAGSHINVG